MLMVTLAGVEVNADGATTGAGGVRALMLFISRALAITTLGVGGSDGRGDVLRWLPVKTSEKTTKPFHILNSAVCNFVNEQALRSLPCHLANTSGSDWSGLGSGRSTFGSCPSFLPLTLCQHEN